MEFKFEDPRPRQTPKGRPGDPTFDAAAEFLRANPNRWVVVKELTDKDGLKSSTRARAQSTAQNMKKRHRLGESVEIVARDNKVYARLVQ